MTTAAQTDRMKRQRAELNSLSLLAQRIANAVPKNAHQTGQTIRGWMPIDHEEAALHLYGVLRVRYEALTIEFEPQERPEGTVLGYAIRWEPA